MTGQEHADKLVAEGIVPDNGWFPIETAPWETDVLVGRWSDDKFIFCQSSQEHDPGNEFEGEAAYDYWATDDDTFGVMDDSMPDVWRPLPAPPVSKSTYFERMEALQGAADDGASVPSS